MRMPANVKSQCMQVQIAEAGAAQIECLFGTQFCVVSVLRLDKCVPMHALMRDCANATDNQMLCQPPNHCAYVRNATKSGMLDVYDHDARKQHQDT